MISFSSEQGRFNFRVAGICIEQGFVLLQQFAGADSWCLPGGRVEMCEPTAIALQREWDEELHETAQIQRLLWVAESFFQTEQAFHEIGFYYLLSLPDVSAYADKTQTYDGVDGAASFILRWFPITALPDVTLFPLFLRARLAALPPTLEHVVEHQ